MSVHWLPNRTPLSHVKKNLLAGGSNRILLEKRKGWLTGLPPHVFADEVSEIPTFIAVGGGKGGVGKSIVSANLAARLGMAGYKVLIVDLDLGSANLHTYFGLTPPSPSLGDFVLQQNVPFKQVLQTTPIQNVSLAAGGKDEIWNDTSDFGTGAFSTLWDALLTAKAEHQFEFVILDLGAGIHRHTIDFFTAAHMGIVTVLPEPTSIENAYSFLKSTLWRLIENAGLNTDACYEADLLKQSLFKPSQATRSYLSKIQQTPETPFIQSVLSALKGRQLGLIVNQIRSQRDIDIGKSMESICKSYFGFDAKSVGYLNYDDAAWKSLRNRRLLVQDFPHSILNKRIGEVTSQLLTHLGYT